MLSLSRLQPGEKLVDLGCGDGRLLRTAVSDFGASQAVGYELDAELVTLARSLNGSDSRLTVHEKDAAESAADLHEADVVSLYLTERGNASLLPLLASTLRPHARVVSYCWGLGGLQPTRTAVARGPGAVLSIGKPNVLLWEYDALQDGERPAK